MDKDVGYFAGDPVLQSTGHGVHETLSSNSKQRVFGAVLFFLAWFSSHNFVHYGFLLRSHLSVVNKMTGKLQARKQQKF